MFKQILIIASFVVFAQSLVLPSIEIKVEQKLTALLMRSTAQMERSPSQTAACFAEYMPKLNNLTTEFEQNLILCEAIAEDRLAYLEVEVNGSRVILTNTASDTCKAYTNCNKKAAAVDFFTCYAEVAGEATKSSFYIEQESNKKVGYIYNIIENVRYERSECSNAAQLKYVEESTQTYADLDKCLAAAQ